VILLGLRNDRKMGWGLDFTADDHNLEVDREHEDGSIGRFDQHPICRERGRLPSTDWSFRHFLSVMFLHEGKRQMKACF
jgi:hypothetical protein